MTNQKSSFLRKIKFLVIENFLSFEVTSFLLRQPRKQQLLRPPTSTTKNIYEQKIEERGFQSELFFLFPSPSGYLHSDLISDNAEKTCFFFLSTRARIGQQFSRKLFWPSRSQMTMQKSLTLEQIFHQATVELTSESFRGGTSSLFFEPK